MQYFAAVVLPLSTEKTYFFFSVAGETCNRNKGRNGRLYPFLLYITVSKNSQTTRGKVKPAVVSIITCQMLRCSTSFTALKSSQYASCLCYRFVNLS